MKHLLSALTLIFLFENSCGSLEFISRLDLSKLDFVIPTSISLDLNDISDGDYNVLATLIESISITSEKKGLCIAHHFDRKKSTRRQWNAYIKDPNITYIFKVEKTDFESAKGLDIEFQPYFYIWLVDKNIEQMYEIQKYVGHSRRQALIASWNKTTDDFYYANEDIYQRRRNLYGSSITAAHAGEPWFVFKADGQFDGFDGDIMQALKDEFNFTIEWVPLNEWGIELSNGSWNGMIGSLIRQEMDMSTTWLIHSEARMKVVQPGFRFMQGSYVIIYKRSSKSLHNFFALTGVFSGTFWIVSLTSCALLWVLLSLSFRLMNQRDWKFVPSFVAVAKAMIGQSTNIHHPENGDIQHSIHGQIFCISLFTGLILWIYTGSLTSFLLASEQNPPLRTLDDLTTKSQFKLYVEHGGAFHDLVLRWAQKSENNELAYQKFVETFPYSQESKVLEKVSLNGESAILTDTTMLGSWLQTVDSCIFAFSLLRGVPLIPIGHLFPKDSMLQPLFGRFQISMHRSGIFHRLIKKYLKPATESMVCIQQPFASIEFNLVEILFWILFLGIFLSLCIFLIQHLCKKYLSKHQLIHS